MKNIGSYVKEFYVQVQHETQKDKERKYEKINGQLVWQHQQAILGTGLLLGGPKERNVNDKPAARWWWILVSNYKMEKG